MPLTRHFDQTDSYFLGSISLSVFTHLLLAIIIIIIVHSPLRVKEIHMQTSKLKENYITT